MFDGETRRYAAALGRRYFQGTVTFHTLFQTFGDSRDPLVQALLEAILHEPRRGFLGVRERAWYRQFWLPVSGLLAELDKGEAGQAPSQRVYPRSGIGRILVWALITLWACAGTVDQANHLWKLLHASASFPLSETLLRSLGLALLMLAAWGAYCTSCYQLHLFRTREIRAEAAPEAAPQGRQPD
jgi:hypothetical protein